MTAVTEMPPKWLRYRLFGSPADVSRSADRATALPNGHVIAVGWGPGPAAGAPAVTNWPAAESAAQVTIGNRLR